MYKRVEKRRRRKEEEEELGLDENMKDVLGLNNTDSDESDSSDAESQDDDVLFGTDEDIAMEEEDDAEEAGDVPLDSTVTMDDASQSDSDDDEDEDVQPPLTVSEALVDPFYMVKQPSKAWACIVCPGKLLKTEQIKLSHKKANAHQRRAKKFAAASKDMDSGSPACLFAVSIASKPLESNGTSKRAQKKEARTVAMKDKRVKAKKAKMKKASHQDSVSPTLLSSVKTTLPSKSPKADSGQRKKRKADSVSLEGETDLAATLPPTSEWTDRSQTLPLKKKPKKGVLSNGADVASKVPRHGRPEGKAKK